MTELEQADQVQASEPTVGQWPHVPPVRGQAYGFKCPSTGAYMVAMSVETWQDFSNQVKQLVKDKEDLQLDLRQTRDFARRLRNGRSVTPGGIITDKGA